MAEQIEIVITQKGGGEGVAQDLNGLPQADAKSEGKESNKTLETALGVWIAKQAWGTTKQVINASISNYANMSGDYITQRRINEALDIAGRVLEVGGTSFVAGKIGFKFGGVYGAVAGAAVGLGVGIAKQGVEGMLAVAGYGINEINTNAQAAMLRAQSGNGNGSRGTNN